MKDDETLYSIDEVILLCKTCEIQFVFRNKTKEFLTESGKDFDALKNEIRQLRAVNACDDPERDYGEGRKGYVYQFKKLVFEKYWCYIKIKIKIKDKRVVVVLSFHKEEFDYEIRRA